MTDDVSRRTLGHYQRNAEAFRSGTWDHDVDQNLDALIAALPCRPGRVLDLGCGPGRDLCALTARGHTATGLDGCAAFVAMARAASGCEVWHQDLLALTLPAARFDGVFANASLFHVPGAHLPRILGELHATLAPAGVVFCSNPRGPDHEGWSGERYGCYFELDRWRALFTAAGFVEVDHYYRPPGRPRDQQPWLAMTWRKLAARAA